MIQRTGDVGTETTGGSENEPAASVALHRRVHGDVRLRTLTDGVFAIAMTLLVLDLRVPDSAPRLGTAVVHTVPRVGIYLLVAAVLGGMWFRNRSESEFMTRVDHAYSWLTFAWLAVVTLIPWSASLMLRHPTTVAGVTTFTVNALVAAAIQQIGWLYATGRRSLTDGLPPRTLRASRLVGFLPVADYAAALAVGIFSPLGGLALNLLAPLVYVTGLLYRLLARLGR